MYTAQSQSLAALEIVVPLDSSELLGKYVVIEVGIDQSLITHVYLALLPGNWRAWQPRSALLSTSRVANGREADFQH